MNNLMIELLQPELVKSSLKAIVSAKKPCSDYVICENFNSLIRNKYPNMEPNEHWSEYEKAIGVRQNSLFLCANGFLVVHPTAFINN